MSKRLPGLGAVRLLASLLVLWVPARGAVQDEPARDRFAELVAQLLTTVETEHIQPPPAGKLVRAGIDHLGEELGVDLGGFGERFGSRGTRSRSVRC